MTAACWQLLMPCCPGNRIVTVWYLFALPSAIGSQYVSMKIPFINWPPMCPYQDLGVPILKLDFANFNCLHTYFWSRNFRFVKQSYWSRSTRNIHMKTFSSLIFKSWPKRCQDPRITISHKQQVCNFIFSKCELQNNKENWKPDILQCFTLENLV